MGVFFVATLLISNTIVSKLVQIGPFSVAGGIILFPVSYIFGDILTEVYGYRASRKIIWLGFGCLIFMSLMYAIVQHLPAASFWPHQEAYDAILGAVPRITFASILAYFCGEFANSYVLSRMKVWMNGKRLWMRTIGSTLVGEGIDTVIMVFVAFGGVFAFPQLLTLIWSGYILKVAYEVIATPVTYAIVRRLKRAEGVDVYDRGINYSPFVVV